MRSRLMSLALALAAACGSESPSGPTLASIAGTWTLTSVNGASLPFVISQAGSTKTEILSNITTITPSGTFASVAQFRTTVNGQATTTSMTATGTFSITGNAVRVQLDSGGVDTGTISGNTLSITDDGFQLTFTKQ